MTRLVLHAGTHATDWLAIQRQLVSWREPLHGLGVRLHPSDDAAAWATETDGICDDVPPQSLVDAAVAAIHDRAKWLLLGSERLEDSLRDPARLASVETFARDHGMPLTVVVVVRDQLGYLNELYCDRITQLQMAREFEAFAVDPLPEERFDYETAFDTLLGLPGTDFIAVPYSSLEDRTQGQAVLTAAGLAETDVAALPPGPGRDPLPGPVAVAATRLLFKRMWRMGLFKSLPRTRLLLAATELRGHAEDKGWDDGPFWGWSKRARTAAINRFRPGNDVFALAAWGREWGDDWESGTYVDVDVAASPPALVVDMLLTVDRIMKDLQKVKATAAAASTAAAGSGD